MRPAKKNTDMTVLDVATYLLKFPKDTEVKIILNDEPVYYELCNLVNKDGTREVYFDLDVER